LAISDKALISATSKRGLLTLSQYKIFVLGLMAVLTLLRSVISIKDVSMPNFGVKFFRNA